MEALAAGLATLSTTDLRLRILVLGVVSGLAVLFGRALYRRILARRDDASGIGRDPVEEHGVVVDPIVDRYGKVRVRDTVWLAAGPDLRPGVAVIVQRRDGTLPPCCADWERDDAAGGRRVSRDPFSILVPVRTNRQGRAFLTWSPPPWRR
jgi:membrane protein implicated in regulation of membrane protease activity